MKRLFLISGAYDLINCLLLIENTKEIYANHLILYSTGNIPEKLENLTRSISERLDCFLSYDFVSKDSLSNEEFQDALCGLIEEKDFIHSDELVIWRLFGKLETNIIRFISPRHLIIVENGLATYYPPVNPQLNGQYRVPDSAILPMQSFFGNPFYVPKNAVKNISKNKIRKTYSKLNALFHDLIPTFYSGDHAIVIGTSFYRMKILPDKLEENTILNCLSHLSKSRSVVFKPHPRDERDWSAIIQDKIHLDLSAIPIEIILPTLGKKVKLHSISSGSLVTGYLFFGSEIICFGEEVANILNNQYPHVKKLRERISELNPTAKS